MRDALAPVGCSALLDRLMVAARAPADYFLLASRRDSQAVSNAWHHPPPRAFADNDKMRVGGRVHAVISRAVTTPVFASGGVPPRPCLGNTARRGRSR